MAAPHDNIFLVIIDQLRADYSKYLPRCSELLPFHAVCDTNSIPASTEAMHANISTGRYPKDHGFISKTIRGSKQGLKQLLDKLTSKELVSLASIGNKHGFKNYIIGGKPETVQVMGLGKECELMLYYDPFIKCFVPRGADVQLVNDIEKLTQHNQYNQINQTEMDSRLLNIIEDVVSLSSQNNAFYICTLPSLDLIGHRSGPSSTKVAEHLNFLDERISSLFSKMNKNSAFIVTGDHGCRKVGQYLIELDADKFTMSVYKLNGDNFEFCERYTLKSMAIEEIHYEGGVIRIWLKHGQKSLLPDDVKFISKYGEVQPSDDEIAKRIYELSKHPNLGDITIVSKRDVMFCKTEWIHDKSAKDKINVDSALDARELYLGEHGTYHDEDRKVLFMSNHDFNLKSLTNTEISHCISRLMKKD